MVVVNKIDRRRAMDSWTSGAGAELVYMKLTLTVTQSTTGAAANGSLAAAYWTEIFLSRLTLAADVYLICTFRS